MRTHVPRSTKSKATLGINMFIICGSTALNITVRLATKGHQTPLLHCIRPNSALANDPSESGPVSDLFLNQFITSTVSLGCPAIVWESVPRVIVALPRVILIDACMHTS